MSRRITVEMPVEFPYGNPYAVLERLEVVCEPDGSTTIRCDALTAARLAGREIFGAIEETRNALEEKIADSWYAADCPR